MMFGLTQAFPPKCPQRISSFDFRAAFRWVKNFNTHDANSLHNIAQNIAFAMGDKGKHCGVAFQ